MEFHYTYMYTYLFSRISTVLLALSLRSLVFYWTTINTEQVHSVLNWNLLQLPAETNFQDPGTWSVQRIAWDLLTRLLTMTASDQHEAHFALVKAADRLELDEEGRHAVFQRLNLYAVVACWGFLAGGRGAHSLRSTGNVTPTTGSCPGSTMYEVVANNKTSLGTTGNRNRHQLDACEGLCRATVTCL